MDGEDLYAPTVDPVDVRRQIGMVFQRPQPLPDDVDLRQRRGRGPAHARKMKKSDLDDLVERSLQGANLWKEVKDRLNRPGSSLSGGSSSGCASPGPSPSSPTCC
jgi:phosphate transport system ATP-binding protein